MDRGPIALIEGLVQGDLQPDLTLLFDLPPEIGLRRARGRGAGDRFESERLTFFEGARAAYLERARSFPRRYRVLDAAQSLASVTGEVRRLLEDFVASCPERGDSQ